MPSASTKLQKEIQMIDIKEAVKHDKKVTFQFYREGNMYYTTEDNELFPVPLEDVGTATLKREEKAILFMRYMRKFNALLKVEKKD